jgi:hypothetical protein
MRMLHWWKLPVYRRLFGKLCLVLKCGPVVLAFALVGCLAPSAEDTEFLFYGGLAVTVIEQTSYDFHEKEGRYPANYSELVAFMKNADGIKETETILRRVSDVTYMKGHGAKTEARVTFKFTAEEVSRYKPKRSSYTVLLQKETRWRDFE